MDNFIIVIIIIIIQQINSYQADRTDTFLILIGQRANCIHWIGIYPLEKVIHPSYNRALINGKPKLSILEDISSPQLYSRVSNLIPVAGKNNELPASAQNNLSITIFQEKTWHKNYTYTKLCLGDTDCCKLRAGRVVMY